MKVIPVLTNRQNTSETRCLAIREVWDRARQCSRQGPLWPPIRVWRTKGYKHIASDFNTWKPFGLKPRPCIWMEVTEQEVNLPGEHRGPATRHAVRDEIDRAKSLDLHQATYPGR